jgi:hypothetical protein
MTAKQSVAVDVGSRTLRTSIAPITLFSCSSVVGVGPPTQLNLGVNQDISNKVQLSSIQNHCDIQLISQQFSPLQKNQKE